MPQCGVEITSNDPALLTFLSKYPQNALWSVIENQGTYYLISPNFQGLAIPNEVWQFADELLFTFNGILRLKFKYANLSRGAKVSIFDANGQLISGSATKSVGLRLHLSAGESYFQDAEGKDLSSIDIWLKAQKDSSVEEALQYYSNPHNWFNLYKTYEIIKKDTNRAGEKGIIPKGVFYGWTKGRHENFEWSANKFRHSSLGYHSKPGIVFMSLQEADDFVSELLFLWLKSK